MDARTRHLPSIKLELDILASQASMVALWRSDATPDCAASGLTAAVLASGLAVVGEVAEPEDDDSDDGLEVSLPYIDLYSLYTVLPSLTLAAML